MILYATILLASSFAQDTKPIDTTATGGVVTIRGERAASTGEAKIDRMSLSVVGGNSVERGVATLPGAHVYTNSRGEALVSIRGSQERQVCVFQDGAPLSLQWDQRSDLSMVPSALVSGIELVRGVPSIHYGPWASGGVVNLVGVASRLDTGWTRWNASVGPQGRRSMDYVAARSRDGGSIVIGGGWYGYDGIATAAAGPDDDEPDASANQASTQVRTNSDLQMKWVSARWRTQVPSGWSTGISGQFLDGSKGDPPSGFPGDSPRFWRIPEWSFGRIVVDANRWVSQGGISSSIWLNSQRQVIDKFTGEQYSTRNAQEDSKDLDFGGRWVGSWKPNSDWKWTASIQAGRGGHDQIDRAFDSAGRPNAAPNLRYRQVVGSAGGELSWQPSRRWLASAGVAWDQEWTLQAGDKMEKPASGLPGGSILVKWSPTSNHALHAAGALRSRFASLRELYGESLRSFAPNPELDPERTTSLELGAMGRSGGLQSEATLFVRRTDGLIDQTRVPDPSNPKRTLRKRVNLEKVVVRGIEFAGAWKPIAPVALQASAALMNSQATDSVSLRLQPQGVVLRSPEVVASLRGEFALPLGFKAAADLSYKGAAWDRHPDPVRTELVHLGESVVVGLHASWEAPQTRMIPKLRLELHQENVFDTPTMPQLGLPGAGRTTYLRTSVEF
ncbi:MAG: TonB-dependent receptor [Fibrobacterota bacterium]